MRNLVVVAEVLVRLFLRLTVSAYTCIRVVTVTVYTTRFERTGCRKVDVIYIVRYMNSGSEESNYVNHKCGDVEQSFDSGIVHHKCESRIECTIFLLLRRLIISCHRYR